MELVIKLSESAYKEMCEHGTDYVDYDIQGMIKNGVVLPKNHGRLIDADKARKVMRDEMAGTGWQDLAMQVVDSEFYTPTIIEAESEVHNADSN